MRANLVESARLDLLGPVEEDELLFDYRVRDRYLVGMLATDGTVATDPLQADDESPDADKSAPEAHENATEHEPSKAMLFPSSLGMSFAVDQALTQSTLRQLGASTEGSITQPRRRTAPNGNRTTSSTVAGNEHRVPPRRRSRSPRAT